MLSCAKPPNHHPPTTSTLLILTVTKISNPATKKLPSTNRLTHTPPPNRSAQPKEPTPKITTPYTSTD
ncbi:MAG: hypothetical protein J5I98_00955, partial [Phaeodactylibacter sp.]|nr:hypothetical protein [Phaeodactylibacter sp.]